MKHFTTILLITLTLPAFSQAVWTPQNSNTSQTLNDVDFYDSDFGVAVGNAGTIVITYDGGDNWSIFTSPTGAHLVQVTVVSPDTFFISNSDAAVEWIYRYTTANGWEPMLAELLPVILDNEDGIVHAASTEVYRSANAGASWDTTYSIFSMVVPDEIEFADASHGCIRGKSSGFANYIPWYIRSQNNSDTWWEFDSGSLPTFLIPTAMSFPSADTGYFFTNQFLFFASTDSSVLWRATEFNLQPGPLSNDSSWAFNGSIIYYNFSDYVWDCHFFSNGKGFATGDDGIVFKTIDGGTSWTVDYPGTNSLRAIIMKGLNLGWAVGAGGTIVKLDNPTSTDNSNNEESEIILYPNPVDNEMLVKFFSTYAGDASVSIMDVLGRITCPENVLDVKAGNNIFNLEVDGLSSGNYFLRINSEKETTITKFYVQR